jgi:transposase
MNQIFKGRFIMSGIHCKKCGSASYVKSGHIRGVQRYKCRYCGCQFTDTAHRGINPSLRAFGVVLYSHCGVSMGNIAKLFKVSTVAVLKWIRQAAAHIPAPKPKQADIVMVDEFWHFVDGKKTKFGCGEPLTGYRVNLSDTTWAIVLMPISKS